MAAATETFFGLLADASSPSALDRLLSIKPRGADKGLSLILSRRSDWRTLVREVPEVAERLADAFWPGPLTLALPAAPGVDQRLLLDGTLAVRLPGLSPAAELARRFGRPLTATSANAPGAPPARDASALYRAFGDAIARGELVVIEDPAPGGLPSTVVVIEGREARIVRAGAIGAGAIERVSSGAGPC